MKLEISMTSITFTNNILKFFMTSDQKGLGLYILLSVMTLYKTTQLWSYLHQSDSLSNRISSDSDLVIDWILTNNLLDK